MTGDNQDPAGGVVLRLAENLDLGAAAPLAAELAANRGFDVELNGSGVRRLGGQCLQILVAAQACWEADDLCLRLASPSQDFVESLALLGAAALFPTREA